MPSVGVLAFIGESFVHNRNKHNYMGDFNGEHQMYDQTRAFLNFLVERQREYRTRQNYENKFYLLEYLDLINELYCREFIDIDDVRGVELWVGYILKLFDNNSNLKIETTTNGTNLFYENVYFQKTISVAEAVDMVVSLQMNWNNFLNIPVWFAMHAHKFQNFDNIHVYLPGRMPCKGLSGISNLLYFR